MRKIIAKIERVAKNASVCERGVSRREPDEFSASTLESIAEIFDHQDQYASTLAMIFDIGNVLLGNRRRKHLRKR